MNYYQETLKKIEDNKHLISMIPVDELLRFGYEAGLNNNSKALDLGCGYGTLLKVWSEAFGISGAGVDRHEPFISRGTERLKQSGVDDKIKLICGDAFNYEDTEKYDVVVCADFDDVYKSEVSDCVKNTISVCEKFLKKGGIIAYQDVYSKVPHPPYELIDFEGKMLTLSELNSTFNELGYYLKCMASDTDSMWEHYAINGFASGNEQQERDKLIENPNDKNIKQSIDNWNRMYFEFRRPYQGQALFGLVKV